MLTIDESFSAEDIHLDLSTNHGTGNPHFIAAVGLLTACHLAALKRGKEDERVQELLQIYRTQFGRLNAAERQTLDRYDKRLNQRYPLDTGLRVLASRDLDEGEARRHQ